MQRWNWVKSITTVYSWSFYLQFFSLREHRRILNTRIHGRTWQQSSTFCHTLQQPCTVSVNFLQSPHSSHINCKILWVAQAVHSLQNSSRLGCIWQIEVKQESAPRLTALHGSSESFLTAKWWGKSCNSDSWALNREWQGCNLSFLSV